MLGFVMTGLLGPKAKSGFTGRMSFLCYSPTTVHRGLNEHLTLKQFAGKAGVSGPLHDDGSKCDRWAGPMPNSSSFPFILLCSFYCTAPSLPCFSHLLPDLPLKQFISEISANFSRVVLPCSGRINNFLHLVIHI